MFYKVIVNNIPRVYNISKAKRVELINNSIYLYYNYTSTVGNMFLFFGDLKEDFDTITFKTAEEANYHFESIEKLLK